MENIIPISSYAQPRSPNTKVKGYSIFVKNFLGRNTRISRVKKTFDIKNAKSVLLVSYCQIGVPFLGFVNSELVSESTDFA